MSSTQDSHTLAIYDTAWVSMVAKNIDGEDCWLFPKSFNFVLERQQENGGWESCSSDSDGLLNTLAALLAMKRHSKEVRMKEQQSNIDLKAPIARAVAYLDAKLQELDVHTNNQVGFEILIPAHLRLLEQEGILFDYPQKAVLEALKESKLKKFSPSSLYGNQKTTLLHSLEAFVGMIDFDRVHHHSTFGSQLGSPSSTAAYLMNCTIWDSEAEAYLRNVICNGSGQGIGGVPSVYPSNIFEITWVRSTGTIFRSEAYKIRR